MRVLSYSVLLFVFWILLSGYFTPLLMGLGLVSVLITSIIVYRMDVIDHESYPLHLIWKLPKFALYLSKEILLSNYDVVKRVLSPKHPSISPKLIKVPLPQKSDLSRAIYANSITLTPGTVSIRLNEDHILVHALSEESAEELQKGKMARQIPDRELSN